MRAKFLARNLKGRNLIWITLLIKIYRELVQDEPWSASLQLKCTATWDLRLLKYWNVEETFRCLDELKRHAVYHNLIIPFDVSKIIACIIISISFLHNVGPLTQGFYFPGSHYWQRISDVATAFWGNAWNSFQQHWLVASSGEGWIRELNFKHPSHKFPRKDGESHDNCLPHLFVVVNTAEFWRQLIKLVLYFSTAESTSLTISVTRYI